MGEVRLGQHDFANLKHRLAQVELCFIEMKKTFIASFLVISLMLIFFLLNLDEIIALRVKR
jgi:hypothetical protein